MVDPELLKKLALSRTAGGVALLALALTLAWCVPAWAAPKRVGNAGADDAPAAAEDSATDGDESPEGDDAEDAGTAAEEEDAPAAPAPASKKPKRVGNAEPGEAEMPAPEGEDEAPPATTPGEDATPPEELLEDASKPREEKKKPAKANKPAAPEDDGAADAPDAPPPPAVPQKPKEKKVKDYVGKADQNKNNKGLYQFESGAYVITTDVSKELANVVAAHMDRVYMAYDERLAGFRPNPFAAVKPNQKMPLYVIRRQRDYLTLMQSFGFNAAGSGGVFFRSRENSGLATWVEGQTRFKMFNVLQHEGFHQFADARIIGGIQLLDGTVIELPPWANEGLAEYFGDAIMVKGELVVGRLDRQRLRRMRQGVKEEVVLPFGELMTMTNDQWVARVNAGDKRVSLMYDSVWSICHFLIEGNKNQRKALEMYLLKINKDFVTDPGKDRRRESFNLIFGTNLGAFEKAWKAGLERMEPDAWYTSIRHLQTVASALQQFHKQEVKVKNWPHLKEQMIRHEVKAEIIERDIVARGPRKEAVEDEEQDLNFPAPAQAHLIPSTDPKLPHGMLITHVEPNILLTWSINENGMLEQDISYLDPPKQQIAEIKKLKREAELAAAKAKRAPKAKPALKAADPAAPAGAAPAKKPGPTTKPAGAKPSAGAKSGKKGTIRVGS
jgi:hypothetical protein